MDPGAGTASNGHDSEARDACYKRVPSCPSGLPSCSIAVQPYTVPPAPCCLGPRDGGWGIPFMLLFGACGILYVGGGVAVSSRGGGSNALSSHPHYSAWREIRALIQDGVHFAQGGGKAGAGGYAPVPPVSGASASPSAGGSRRGEESKPQTSSSKKEEKSKSSKEKKSSGGKEKGGSGKRSKKGQGGAEDPSTGPGGSLDVDGAGAGSAGLLEQREHDVHESQAKIKVVGLNSI